MGVADQAFAFSRLTTADVLPFESEWIIAGFKFQTQGGPGQTQLGPKHARQVALVRARQGFGLIAVYDEQGWVGASLMRVA